MSPTRHRARCPLAPSEKPVHGLQRRDDEKSGNAGKNPVILARADLYRGPSISTTPPRCARIAVSLKQRREALRSWFEARIARHVSCPRTASAAISPREKWSGGRRRRLPYLGMRDHRPQRDQARGRGCRTVRTQFAAIRKLNAEFENFRSSRESSAPFSAMERLIRDEILARSLRHRVRPRFSLFGAR